MMKNKLSKFIESDWDPNEAVRSIAEILKNADKEIERLKKLTKKQEQQIWKLTQKVEDKKSL